MILLFENECIQFSLVLEQTQRMSSNILKEEKFENLDVL